MGTRGLLGFKVDDNTKATYNHWDSYPGVLGINVLTFLRKEVTNENIPLLDHLVRGLKMVSNDTPPTADDVAKLMEYANVGVGQQSLDDWYVLLRETQGDPEKILMAGYAEDAFKFGYDSLFCEWGYVVDLDAGQLDVYRGFNTGPAVGTWANSNDLQPSVEYGPITLIKSYRFDDLPTDETFIADLEGSEG